ncbi:Acyl transferase/acyl hydrolase/lysophospholipase [Penicillium argentinense]|uniref:Acyl transferase/acyl hydrolase/lysophospholipase n=1 Tax=Penicillium argentinense TaxID=1131581 RepID=A0A9W9ENU5_9EURO|nr:Acyl transferase/acyl hydrolase/lysophospholipase [Penicillium argentinense]KAJ5085106.1 Acyl transferase/acyl hydrolase/lysophospholipase [Penicillium argentinense]
MLGRLEMDIDECINAYTELMTSVFREKASSLPIDWSGNIKAQYDSKGLRCAIENVISRTGTSPVALMDDGFPRRCRAFVCATAKETLQTTRLRSYTVSNEETIPATICEAALATAAATRFFEPVMIGNHQFVDGAFGANNPIEEVEEEATDIWCPRSRELKPLVKCIVSIGTGNPGQKALDDNILRFLTKTLVRMATKPEGTERRFIARWQNEFNEKRYFRFNVDQGLQDVRMTDYSKRNIIETTTHDYLHHATQKSRIRDCIVNLVEKGGMTGDEQEKPILILNDPSGKSYLDQPNQKFSPNSKNGDQNHKALTLHDLVLRRTQLNTHFLATRSPCWIVPFERNARFVDREALTEIKLKLLTSDHSERTALFGLGGSGKTQIAIELAYETRERWPDRSVFWIPALNHESIQQAYQKIGHELGLEQNENEKEDIKTQVQKYLSHAHTKPWLLIFDHVDDIDLWVESNTTRNDGLMKFLPKHHKGVILFTTRSKRVAHKLASTGIIELPEMDERRATSVLRNSLVDKSLLNNREHTKVLLERLAFLPLAITQAASFLNENQMDIASYIRLLDGQEQDAIDLLGEDFEDEGRGKSIRNAIAKKWLTSFSQLAAQNSFASECLSIMACLNPRDIPVSILPRRTELELEKAIGILSSYSFVRAQESGKYLDLHPLVHLATRNFLRSNGSWRDWQRRAIVTLGQRFPAAYNGGESVRNLWRSAMAHGIYIVDEIAAETRCFWTAQLLYSLACCTMLEARYKDAEKHCLKAIELKKEVFGSKIGATLPEMSLLATIYHLDGQIQKALVIAEESLKSHKELFGGNDRRTVTSRTKISLVYKDSFKYEEAEKLARESLRFHLRNYDLTHYDTIVCLDILTSLYIDRGQFQNAAELSQVTYQITQRICGRDHPLTIPSASRLAVAYHRQWRLDEANAIVSEILPMSQMILGDCHPTTLSIILSLALIARDRNEDSEALGLMTEMVRMGRGYNGTYPITLDASALLSEWQNEYV